MQIDDMIKINGNRIEPSEIGLVCKKALGIKLDKLPLTVSGKIDKNELKLPTKIIKTKYVVPRDDFEIDFAKAIEQITSIDKIGINDDIFLLGLNSIGVMKVLYALDKYKFLSTTIIYNGRTISEISRLYSEEKNNYLTIEEKEDIGRKANFPISNTTNYYYECINDTSFDLNAKIEFPFFIPKHLLVNRINELIRNDSTFNLVLKRLDDGLIHYVYNENTPYVKLEYMTEEELLNVDKTFLKPFELNEPLIRLRIIECKRKTYLYLQVAHIAMDGAGYHNFLSNIQNAFERKKIEKIYYFAWVYDENKRVCEEKKDEKENLDYFEKNYFLEKYDDNCLKKEITGDKGVNISKCISISLKRIEDYCKSNNITTNTFIVVAANLAQLKYNKSKYNIISWNYENRGPSDNKTGIMIRCVYFKLDLRKVKNLKEAYNEFKRQSEEQIKRIYNTDYHLKYLTYKGMCFDMTYLSNWFMIGKKKSLFYKILPLTPSVIKKRNVADFICVICDNDNKNMNFFVKYGLPNYKSESIDKYMDILKNVIVSMLNNSIDVENLV